VYFRQRGFIGESAIRHSIGKKRYLPPDVRFGIAANGRYIVIGRPESGVKP
jgi:hypothetical protein